MKNTIFTLLVFFNFSFYSYSQLNDTARFIKSDKPEMYAPIRAMAVEKWGSDDEMIVYTINEQSEALYYCLIESGKNDFSEMVEAMEKWTEDKVTFKRALNLLLEEIDNSYNEGRDLNTDLYIRLFTIPTDWSMVRYTYDSQMKAKDSY